MSTNLRITGLASGLDVDTIVKQMMKYETAKVDKVKQQRQLIQWRQDIYRDLIGELNTFKNTYFNVLKSDSYILSKNNYSSFQVKSTDSTNAVTAVAQAGAVAGKYTVHVDQLAEKAVYTGSTTLNTAVAKTGVVMPVKIDSTNNQLTVDGKAITLTEGKYNNLNELASHINTKISGNTDLKNTVKAVVKNNEIQFAHTVQIIDAGTEKNNEVNITTGTSTFKVTLSNGYYTLDELAVQINNQLKSAKDSSGNSIPDGFKAEVAADGMSIAYTLGGSPDKSYSISDIATISSTGTGTSTGTEPIVSSDRLSYKKDVIEGFNDTLNIKVGATTYTIKLDAAIDYSSMNDTDVTASFINQINAGIDQLKDSYGNPIDIGVEVSQTADNRIKFNSTTNNQVSISGNAAAMIGVPSGFQVNQSIGDNITNIFSGKAMFTINGVEFRYDFDSAVDSGAEPTMIVGAKNKSLSNILSDISNKANVEISYSQLTRKFTIASKTTGADQLIVDTKDITDAEFTQNFLGTLLGESVISDSSGNLSTPGTKLQGKDATVTITEPNGAPTTIYQATNSFTLDGVTYTLNEKPASDITLTLISDTSSSFEKITGFINKYNEIIDKINSKLVEKRQYDYSPLTDEQKKEMNEDDIKIWEEKAKEGLIKGDSTLENALFNMRKAFYDSVKVAFNDPQMSNIGITLKDVGMSTSSDISQRGKIIIDEQKLKDALQNNSDKVTELFTKTSSTIPSYSRDLTMTQRNQRYSEEGVFQRIKDILEDNLSTLRNSKGQKGTLIEKAGIKGDFTEYHNLLTDELDEKDKLISELNKKLITKENYYYLQYSKLEVAMEQMNSQQSWFSQQISAMNGGN